MITLEQIGGNIMLTFSERQIKAINSINKTIVEGLEIDKYSDVIFTENNLFIQVEDYDLGVVYWVEDQIDNESSDCTVHEVQVTIQDIHTIAADFMVVNSFLRRDGDIGEIKNTNSTIDWDFLKLEALHYELDCLSHGKLGI